MSPRPNLHLVEGSQPQLDEPSPEGLSRLVDEIKRAPTPRIDTEALEARLFARLDDGDQPSLPPVPTDRVVFDEPQAPSRFVRIAAPIALAAAAAVAVAFGLGRGAPQPRADLAKAAATTQAQKQPDATPQVVQSPAQPRGRLVTAGDAAITLQRDGLATYELAAGTRAHVDEQTDDQGPRIELALEQGAVTFDVTPQPVPDRVVVLAGKTRVAVKGTRFRVARDGDKVDVDVDRGVVSVGIVGDDTAPASLLRAPAGATHAASTGKGEQRPLAPFVSSTPRPTAPSTAARKTPEREAPVVDQALRSAVQTLASRCFELNSHIAAGVDVTFTTSLSLSVDPAGHVTTASFSPPPSPAVETCFRNELKSLHGARGQHTFDITLSSRR